MAQQHVAIDIDSLPRDKGLPIGGKLGHAQAGDNACR
jgi:hypothetical protein